MSCHARSTCASASHSQPLPQAGASTMRRCAECANAVDASAPANGAWRPRGPGASQQRLPFIPITSPFPLPPAASSFSCTPSATFPVPARLRFSCIRSAGAAFPTGLAYFLTCPASSFSHFRSACSILLVTDAPATRSTTLSSRGVHLEQPILIILPSIRPPLSGECLSPPAAHSTLLPLSRLRSHAFFFY